MGTAQSKDQRGNGTAANKYLTLYPFNSNNYIQCDAPPLPPPPPMNPNAPPPPPPSESGASSSSSSPTDDIADAAAFASNVTNPGPYEGAIMPCKAITALDTPDGFRMEIQKQLSPFMVIMHNFSLGTTFPDGSNKAYSMLTQVADESGVIMTSFDPMKKAVTGRVIQALLGGLATGKLQASVSPDGSNDTLLGELDINAMTWSGNLKYGSMGGGLVFGMNYYQSITHRLAMGGEGMYVAANGNMMSSYTVKYEMPASSGEEEDENVDAISAAAKSVGGDGNENLSSRPSSWFLAQLNPAQGMLNLYYKRIVTPNRVTLGAEMMMVPTLESEVTFGAEFKLARSKVKLACNGTGKIQSILETKLGMSPQSPTLSLNAEVDHGKDSMKFGYGLSVGS
jgi:mitochondrial import receptor subunit TOM40